MTVPNKPVIAIVIAALTVACSTSRSPVAASETSRNFKDAPHEPVDSGNPVLHAPASAVQIFTDERTDPYDPSGPCLHPPCAPPNRWDGVFMRESFAVSNGCSAVVSAAFQRIANELHLPPTGELTENRVAQFAMDKHGYVEVFYEYDSSDSKVELHLGIVSPPSYRGGRWFDVPPEYMAPMFSTLRGAARTCAIPKKVACADGCPGDAVCIEGLCGKVEACGDIYRIKQYVQSYEHPANEESAKELEIPPRCIELGPTPWRPEPVMKTP